MPKEINSALLLAAGSGLRMEGVVNDKILAPISGKPAFSYSLEAFAACEAITHICIVYRDEKQRAALETLIGGSSSNEILWAQGGAERQDSVLSGLEALPVKTSQTLIHDCARPLVSTNSIQMLIDATRKDGAACLAHSIKDTIKRIPQANRISQTSLEDLDRTRLWAMETPQAFRHNDILRAYQKVKATGLSVTDDTAAAAHIGSRITLVPNTAPNPKITTADDLNYLEWLLSK